MHRSATLLAAAAILAAVTASPTAASGPPPTAAPPELAIQEGVSIYWWSVHVVADEGAILTYEGVRALAPQPSSGRSRAQVTIDRSELPWVWTFSIGAPELGIPYSPYYTGTGVGFHTVVVDDPPSWAPEMTVKPTADACGYLGWPDFAWLYCE